MLLQKLSLIAPSAEYKSAYDSFCDECLKTSEQLLPWLIHETSAANTAPENNQVPTSTYWLIDGNQILGAAHIRHKLNVDHLISGGHIECVIRKSQRGKGLGTELLRLGLDKAEELGIRGALLICNKNDVASQRIIDKNGGIFESALTTKEDKILFRYWIRI